MGQDPLGDWEAEEVVAREEDGAEGQADGGEPVQAQGREESVFVPNAEPRRPTNWGFLVIRSIARAVEPRWYGNREPPGTHIPRGKLMVSN
jgi:hypothetical protein